MFVLRHLAELRSTVIPLVCLLLFLIETWIEYSPMHSSNTITIFLNTNAELYPFYCVKLVRGKFKTEMFAFEFEIDEHAEVFFSQKMNSD